MIGGVDVPLVALKRVLVDAAFEGPLKKQRLED